MYLTDDEKRILDGKSGSVARRCMEFLVDYGEAAGAERLVDVDGSADIHPGGNPFWVADYAIKPEEITDLAKRGEKFKVPTFANKPVPGYVVDGWESCGTWPNEDSEYHKTREREYRALIQMGMIPTLSCDYYLGTSFYPTAGQHCSWGESSAIPWANAVLGARTNFDGSFQTAYLGKTPYYDLHLDEKRIAGVLAVYEGEPLKNDIDYELFGWVAGEMIGNDVPAFINLGRPTVSQLVKMNSALNTGGQVRMYHIPGITPEATTVEDAFRRRKPENEIVIRRSDLKKAYEMINAAACVDVDFVYLGCPFYNIIEVQKTARLLYGKKCKANLWVVTSPGVYHLAEQMGLKDIIERSGARFISGVCACEMRGELLPFDVMATDAMKQNYYITGHMYPKKKHVWYGSAEECVDAAITGIWRGEWR